MNPDPASPSVENQIFLAVSFLAFPFGRQADTGEGGQDSAWQSEGEKTKSTNNRPNLLPVLPGKGEVPFSRSPITI